MKTLLIRTCIVINFDQQNNHLCADFFYETLTISSIGNIVETYSDRVKGKNIVAFRSKLTSTQQLLSLLTILTNLRKGFPAFDM